MRLLIITQRVDTNDPGLGFFHRWIEEFAKHFPVINVICLGKGEYALPSHIGIASLGKEERQSRIQYILRFYKYLWKFRNEYDAVFVHMNQEYVLLAGLWWRFTGKKIFLWRNHKKGNIFTNIAVSLAHKVFYTSPRSYTARFKKAEIMPVGIDTDFFAPDPKVHKKPHSILFLGRIAPVKKVLEFIDWLHELQKKGKDFSVSIVGDALPQDLDYEKKVRERALSYGFNPKITWAHSVTQTSARDLYRTHETYVNLTPSGSMDKTILEAAATGTSVVVANEDLKNLEAMKGEELRNFVIHHHSLKLLVQKLEEAFLK